MGQYYEAINLSKNEKIKPGDYGCGSKLMEHSSVGNAYVNALSSLLSDKWRKDTVIVCGDYALDTEDAPKNEGNKWIAAHANEFALPDMGYALNERLTDLQTTEMKNDRHAGQGQEKPQTSEEKTSGNNVNMQTEKTLRYIINADIEVAIDRTVEPVSAIFYNGEDITIRRLDALVLMLACGNGMGGGDYYGAESESVGAWCGQDVYCSDILPANIEIIDSPFYETREPIRGTDKEIRQAFIGAWETRGTWDGKVFSISGSTVMRKDEIACLVEGAGGCMRTHSDEQVDVLICNNPWLSDINETIAAKRGGALIVNEWQLANMLENPIPNGKWFYPEDLNRFMF